MDIKLAADKIQDYYLTVFIAFVADASRHESVMKIWDK